MMIFLNIVMMLTFRLISMALPSLLLRLLLVLVEVRGVRVAWLAFDATGATMDNSTLIRWDVESGSQLIAEAVRRSDIVIAGIHGGTEYHPMADADTRARAVRELSILAEHPVPIGYSMEIEALYRKVMALRQVSVGTTCA